MTNPTPEQIEAAAKAMCEAEYPNVLEAWEHFRDGDGQEAWRKRARTALVAAAGVTPQEPVVGPVTMSIMNGWLVEAVGEHTCGAGADGYGHEPGCGYVPVLNLADLDGYPPQVDEAKLPAVTRVTLAGRAGTLSAEHWDYEGVELVVQDDGRTLKVLPLRGGGQ